MLICWRSFQGCFSVGLVDEARCDPPSLRYKMVERENKTLIRILRTPGGNLIKAAQSDVLRKLWMRYSFSSNLLNIIKKKKGTGREMRKKRATTVSSCVLLRVGGLKTARSWEGSLRDSERGLAVGQITCVSGVHTDFMKLISKQQLEEKARQRHTRTAAEKGIRNAIFTEKKEEPASACVSIYMLAQSSDTSPPL